MELLEKITNRPFYVFSIPDKILNTLSHKKDTGDNCGNELLESVTTKAAECMSFKSEDGPNVCSICRVSYSTERDQRSHARSDLHGYNLKQKIQGLLPVTESEFEELVRDLNDTISGSDSSASEDEEIDSGRKGTLISALFKKQATLSADCTVRDNLDSDQPKPRPKNSPLIWFTTTELPPKIYLGIYRSVFTNGEQKNDSQFVEIIKRKQLASKPLAQIRKDSSGGSLSSEACNEPHYFLCMIGGGHFAAMVVSLIPKEIRSVPTGPLIKEATVIAHKTFHRYTTRRKQGGAQSANDSAKGAAHSAGANLRRHNEQALTEEVRVLLQDWKSMIDSSELLFIRATGSTNRRTLYGPYNNQILRLDDPRIRGFPFNTRRPTQNELLRSFTELTRVKVHEVDEKAIEAAKVAASKAATQSAIKETVKQNSQVPSRLTEEEETALLHSSQIQAMIRRCRLPALLSYLKSNSLSPEFRFHPLNSPQNYHAPTPLLLAASLNSTILVTGLLLKAGADPSVRNDDGKTAFELSGERATRQAFCVARFEIGEDRWNWDQAGIPKGISRIEAEAINEREVEQEQRNENERRKAETDRLKLQDEKDTLPLRKGKALMLSRLPKTAQEKREEEARGLTPEMQLKLDRERRARAAEERMKKIIKKPS